jgi:hypothetical protein
MDGQAQRGSPGRGRSSRRGSSSHRVAAGSGAGRGLATTTTAPATTAPAPGVLGTRATYRLLLMKGMSTTEAANLTAFLCGLSTTDVQWSLKQVNQLLFLRRMRETGRFDDHDGSTARPH